VFIVNTSELMVKGGNRRRWFKLYRGDLAEFSRGKAEVVELRQARILD
jgi:hypothetical protein